MKLGIEKALALLLFYSPFDATLPYIGQRLRPCERHYQSGDKVSI